MNKQKKSSRKMMDSRTKGRAKQVPALYNRVNPETERFESYSNRALRKANAARARRAGISAN